MFSSTRTNREQDQTGVEMVNQSRTESSEDEIVAEEIPEEENLTAEILQEIKDTEDFVHVASEEGRDEFFDAEQEGGTEPNEKEKPVEEQEEDESDEDEDPEEKDGKQEEEDLADKEQEPNDEKSDKEGEEEQEQESDEEESDEEDEEESDKEDEEESDEEDDEGQEDDEEQKKPYNFRSRKNHKHYVQSIGSASSPPKKMKYSPAALEQKASIDEENQVGYYDRDRVDHKVSNPFHFAPKKKVKPKKNAEKKPSTRDVNSRPTTFAQVKDDTVARKFELAARRVVELQLLSTWEDEIDQNEHPKVQFGFFSYDEMVAEPNNAKNARFRRQKGGQFTFQVPEGFDLKVMGEKLEKIGKEMKKGARGTRSGKNWKIVEYIKDHHHRVFGPNKKFRPQNKNKQAQKSNKFLGPGYV